MNNPKYNSEGYPDPTAFYGMQPVVKEESETEKRIRNTLHIIRNVAALAGFDIVGRITFKDKKTGKEYR